MAGGIALQSSSGGTVTFTIPETSTSSTINLDFTSLKSANGYQKLPGGIIIQWGENTSTSTTAVNMSFPISFPTACWQVVVSQGIQNGHTFNPSATNMTNSGFCLRLGNGTDVDLCRWIAIGY